jgi:hypothetical protein
MQVQPNIKFVGAQQAKQIHRYKNIRLKLKETNAAKWYNKTCRHNCSILTRPAAGQLKRITLPVAVHIQYIPPDDGQ